MDFLESEDYETVFRWIDKSTYGQADFDKHLISINVYWAVADTLIHEYLHAKHPKWTEERVRNRTSEIIRKMTVEEIITMAKQALAKIPWER
jgi:hypothetical protein